MNRARTTLTIVVLGLLTLVGSSTATSDWESLDPSAGVSSLPLQSTLRASDAQASDGFAAICDRWTMTYFTGDEEPTASR